MLDAGARKVSGGRGAKFDNDRGEYPLDRALSQELCLANLGADRDWLGDVGMFSAIYNYRSTRGDLAGADYLTDLS